MGCTKTENCAVKFPFQHNSGRGEYAISLAVHVIVGYQVYMTSGTRWYARVRGQDSCLQFRVICLNIKCSLRLKARVYVCQIFNYFNLYLHTRVKEMETPAHFPVTCNIEITQFVIMSCTKSFNCCCVHLVPYNDRLLI
jgi:hypothetical protein